MHPAEAVPVVVADGAGTEKGETHPQAGFIVAMSNQTLAAGQEAPFNVLAARSGKVDRICNSSLASSSFKYCLGEVESFVYSIVLS